MLHNGKTARPGKAGGSTLMISLMVIVIFGAFAYALNKMKTDTADTFNNSLMYEKAAQAAYSVLEMATYELYPLNRHSADEPGTPVNDTVGGCRRVTTYYATGRIIPGARGLDSCYATVSCERKGAVVDVKGAVVDVVDAPADYSEYTKMVHYFLTVVATCKAGNFLGDTYYIASKKIYSELVDGE